MPLTLRSKLMTELDPVIRAGVRAAHLRAHYADDAVQQTLLALVPQIARLSEMPENERRAYVFVTASRTAMAFRKRLGSDEARGSDAEVAAWARRNGVPVPSDRDAPSPEQDAVAAQRGARAQRALRSMPTGDRNVIEAVAHDGLSERDAAEQLGISRGGVAYRLRRARELLGRAWNGTTSWARRGPEA
jgi:RNA polymerase sigma factor (sigma-70 family)